MLHVMGDEVRDVPIEAQVVREQAEGSLRVVRAGCPMTRNGCVQEIPVFFLNLDCPGPVLPPTVVKNVLRISCGYVRLWFVQWRAVIRYVVA